MVNLLWYIDLCCVLLKCVYIVEFIVLLIWCILKYDLFWIMMMLGYFIGLLVVNGLDLLVCVNELNVVGCRLLSR